VNLCCACQTDFASVKAFDTHRIGVHAYTFAEGLEMDPERIDGRRCADGDEMLAAGLELDTQGRWCIPSDVRERMVLRRAA
jgi:hypothetical protein